MRNHSLKLIKNIKIDELDQQKDHPNIIKELKENTNDVIHLNGIHNSKSRSSRKNSIHQNNYNEHSRTSIFTDLLR
jgi:hypothetical protein